MSDRDVVYVIYVIADAQDPDKGERIHELAVKGWYGSGYARVERCWLSRFQNSVPVGSIGISYRPSVLHAYATREAALIAYRSYVEGKRSELRHLEANLKAMRAKAEDAPAETLLIVQDRAEQLQGKGLGKAENVVG